MKKVLLTLVALMMFAVPCTFAAEVEGDSYIGVYEKYLWRGWDFSGEADYVVQYGTDLSMNGFTLSWWGNHNTDTGDLDEVDVVLDYSFDLSDTVSVSVGNILYDVDGAEDTNELYLSLGLATILEPSLTVYYDYDEFNADTFATLAVGHGFDLADSVSLSVGALASYYKVDNEDFAHNGELSLGLDYAVSDALSAGISYLYSTPLSDDAEDIAGIDDEATGGVSLSYSF